MINSPNVTIIDAVESEEHNTIAFKTSAIAENIKIVFGKLNGKPNIFFLQSCGCHLNNQSNSIIAYANPTRYMFDIYGNIYNFESDTNSGAYITNQLGYNSVIGLHSAQLIKNLPTILLDNFTSFHSDPVYIEATKLKYTDGTYNFARGNKTADAARKAAYKHLLNTYGSFYKGTEEQLSQSFNQSLE